MGKYRIANLNININFFNKEIFNKHFENYRVNITKVNDSIKDYAYFKEKKDSGISNIKVIVEDDIKYIRESKNEVIIDNVYRYKNYELAKDNTGYFHRYVFNKSNNKILNKIIYNKDYSNIEIYINKNRENEYMSLKDWEYVYTGFVFNDMVLKNGGVTLHGSCISYKGNGVIFSANSGVGKSTHANLWAKKFEDDVVFVNDDKPVIYFENNKYYVYGTPWSGKHGINNNIRVELKAIVFIKRDKENWIEEMSVPEKMLNLSEQVYRAYYDKELDVKAMDFLGNLISNVNIFCLHCNISNEAVELAYNKIFDENVF